MLTWINTVLYDIIHTSIFIKQLFKLNNNAPGHKNKQTTQSIEMTLNWQYSNITTH